MLTISRPAWHTPVSAAMASNPMRLNIPKPSHTTSALRLPQTVSTTVLRMTRLARVLVDQKTRVVPKIRFE